MVITVNLGDREKIFRELAKKKFGNKKGYLQKASIEAIENWMREQEGIIKLQNLKI